MRVRWPGPCARNHATTSESTRMLTTTLATGVGNTTRACFQNPAGTPRIGASGRVRSGSRRTCSGEYRLIPGFARMVQPPGGDDPARRPAPGEDDEQVEAVDLAEGHPARLRTPPRIRAHEVRPLEDAGRAGEVHAVAP